MQLNACLRNSAGRVCVTRPGVVNVFSFNKTLNTRQRSGCRRVILCRNSLPTAAIQRCKHYTQTALTPLGRKVTEGESACVCECVHLFLETELQRLSARNLNAKVLNKLLNKWIILSAD